MMRTHPELSPAGVLTPSLSRLCRLGFRLLCFSGDEDRIDDFELDAVGDADPEGPAFGREESCLMFGVALLVTLPIRRRGTRVCIFCSNTLTRARISETICTPLLRVDVPATVLVVLVLDTRRGAGMGGGCGLEVPVRGGGREGVVVGGTVLERMRGDGMPVDAPRADRGWNPARCRTVGWPDVNLAAASDERGVVVMIGGNSLDGVSGDCIRSESCKSCEVRLDNKVSSSSEYVRDGGISAGARS